MKLKQKIAVIMGGVSSEHEVSMMSGKEIIKNLDKNKYKVIPIIINKNGKGTEKIIKIKPDVAFIALHGKGGEDGCIQGLLESLGIKYTGSGVAASAVGINKIIFRNLMKIHKIRVPDFIVVEKKDDIIIPDFRPEYFVKPYDGGSSVGVSLVTNKKDLKKAVKLAFKYSEKVMIDKYIKGLEISCGVLGNNDPKALSLIEIHPLRGEFFDYKSKYEKEGSEEIVPARVSPAIAKKIQKLSVAIYKIVGCSGYARIDFILKDGKEPVVLEINTLPGMTASSLLPKEAEADGISYSELLNRIIGLAVVE